MACFDEPGDLQLTADETNFILADDVSILMAQISNGFLTPTASWAFDTSQGFPLFTAGFTTTWKLPFLLDSVREYLLSFADVERVTELTVDPIKDERGLTLASVVFSLDTTFGPVTSDQIYLPVVSEIP